MHPPLFFASNALILTETITFVLQELEDFVKNLQEDLTDKISVFSGPIYTSSINETKFIGNPPAAIPTSFFKVVAFVDKQGKFATRAFIMAQDKFALSDKNAKNRRFDLGAYQVPVKLIEEETGLVFDQKLRETNPLIFTEPEPVAEPVKLAPRETFPQIIPVGPDTVQPDMGPAPTIASDTKMAIICTFLFVRLPVMWLSKCIVSNSNLLRFVFQVP